MAGSPIVLRGGRLKLPPSLLRCPLAVSEEKKWNGRKTRLLPLSLLSISIDLSVGGVGGWGRPSSRRGHNTVPLFAVVFWMQSWDKNKNSTWSPSARGLARLRWRGGESFQSFNFEERETDSTWSTRRGEEMQTERVCQKKESQSDFGAVCVLGGFWRRAAGNHLYPESGSLRA